MHSLKLTRRPPVTNDKCSTLKQMRLVSETKEFSMKQDTKKGICLDQSNRTSRKFTIVSS